MAEDKEEKKQVIITLEYDSNKYPDQQIFLMWIDSLGEEYGFRTI